MREPDTKEHWVANGQEDEWQSVQLDTEPRSASPRKEVTPPGLVRSLAEMAAHPHPVAEALHLRRVIEQQPSCLLRVGIDGVVLAANEAALGLLGAGELPQVLGTTLTALMVPRDRDQWSDFAARIRDGAACSIECEVTDLSGARRTLLLQGIPLLDHQDGVLSMILAARDTSAQHRLETALQEREGSQQLDDLRAHLEEAFGERRAIATTLQEREADHQRVVAERAVERTRAEQTLAEEHQLALLLKEREGRQLLNAVRAELAQAIAEQQRLTLLAGEREADHQRVVAGQAAERGRGEQTLAEEHQLALLLKEREGRQLLNAVRAELDQAIVERQQLAAHVEEREADHQRAVAEQAAERVRAEQALAEEHLALVAEAREADRQRVVAEQAAERARAEQSLADEQRLALVAEAREADRQRVVAEQAAERARAEQSLAEEHQFALVGEAREADRQRVIAEQAAERARAEQSLAEERQLALVGEAREADRQRVVAEQAAERARAEQSLAEEHQLALVAEAREADRQREVAEQAAERARAEQSLAEEHQLALVGEAREADRQRVVAEQAAERARAEQTLAEEHQRALALQQREGRQLLDAVRAELDQAIAERQQLVALVEEREADRQRVVAEHSAERAQAEQVLAAAALTQTEMKKALADTGVELQCLTENARRLEWLAAAGRVALDVGRDLETIGAAVDLRTQYLLAQSSLEADDRHVLEALRSDAICAASLARQIIQAGPEPRARSQM